MAAAYGRADLMADNVVPCLQVRLLPFVLC